MPALNLGRFTVVLLYPVRSTSFSIVLLTLALKSSMCATAAKIFSDFLSNSAREASGRSVSRALSHIDQTLQLRSQGGEARQLNPEILTPENPTTSAALPAPRLPGAFDGFLCFAVFVAQVGDLFQVLTG